MVKFQGFLGQKGATTRYNWRETVACGLKTFTPVRLVPIVDRFVFQSHLTPKYQYQPD